MESGKFFGSGNMTDEGYAAWMGKVNGEVLRRAGCDYRDLPDCCYRDWYEDGVTPKQAAARAIRAAKE